MMPRVLAVHAHPVCVVTDMLPVAPLALTDTPVGEMYRYRRMERYN